MPRQHASHPSTRCRVHARAQRIRSAKSRAGRALVELVVSTLLLSVAAAATLSLLQLTVTASIRIADLTLARDLARDLAEHTVAAPCAAGVGSATRERVDAHWLASTVSESVHVSLSIDFFPLPGGSMSPPRTLNAVLAGWCT